MGYQATTISDTVEDMLALGALGGGFLRAKPAPARHNMPAANNMAATAKYLAMPNAWLIRSVNGYEVVESVDISKGYSRIMYLVAEGQNGKGWVQGPRMVAGLGLEVGGSVAFDKGYKLPEEYQYFI